MRNDTVRSQRPRQKLRTPLLKAARAAFPQYQRTAVFRALWLLLGSIGVFIFSTAAALAVDGRDFAGFYEVGNVRELGDDVELTFSVRIYNYSDADVTAATVTVQDALDCRTSYMVFPDVSLPDRNAVRLSSAFVMPRREYERWQAGASPLVFIEFVNGAGNRMPKYVELVQALGREEE